jgi:hypothetical protein
MIHGGPSTGRRHIVAAVGIAVVVGLSACTGGSPGGATPTAGPSARGGVGAAQPADGAQAPTEAPGTPTSAVKPTTPAKPAAPAKPTSPGKPTTPWKPAPATSIRTVKEATFLLPSKNIGCGMWEGRVRCDIADKTWTLPPKPASCVEGDWAYGIFLNPGTKAKFGCPTDSALGAQDILAYGHALRVGHTICDSEAAAVKCWNDSDGHGFTLSKENYSLF